MELHVQNAAYMIGQNYSVFPEKKKTSKFSKCLNLSLVGTVLATKAFVAFYNNPNHNG